MDPDEGIQGRLISAVPLAMGGYEGSDEVGRRRHGRRVTGDGESGARLRGSLWEVHRKREEHAGILTVGACDGKNSREEVLVGSSVAVAPRPRGFVEFLEAAMAAAAAAEGEVRRDGRCARQRLGDGKGGAGCGACYL